jgi:FkbM family methyltransferase
VRVPLANGLVCPVTSLEHWVSYENIFCEKEYDALLAKMPLPVRWIDLGCHAGHFTLRLAMLQRTPWSALLVDADSRSAPAVRAMIEANRFDAASVKFLHAAIGESGDDVAFAENVYMTSEATRGAARAVRRLLPEEMLAKFLPPYDLVKLDIEGAEFAFFKSYEPVLRRTRRVLFEWHSWQPGGGGKAQLIAMAEQLGFRFVGEQHAERTLRRDGKPVTAGLVLMENERLG